MPVHEIEIGESVESLAERHGLFWRTIWEHAENEGLRKLRSDPNVLLAGDPLFIPDKRPKEVEGATDQRHHFRRKGVPSEIGVQFLDKDGEPRVGLRYELDIESRLVEGKTDADGRIREMVPPSVRTVTLRLFEEQSEPEEYTLMVGHLDPLDTVEGQKTRLFNLDYFTGAIDADVSVEFIAAIEEFQSDQELDVTGEVDEPTRKALENAAIAE